MQQKIMRDLLKYLGKVQKLQSVLDKRSRIRERRGCAPCIFSIFSVHQKQTPRKRPNETPPVGGVARNNEETRAGGAASSNSMSVSPPKSDCRKIQRTRRHATVGLVVTASCRNGWHLSSRWKNNRDV